MELLVTATIFVLVLTACGLLYSLIGKNDTRPLHQVASRFTAQQPREEKDIDIFHSRKYSNINLFNRSLAILPGVVKLDGLLQQSGVKMLVGPLILLTLTLGVAGYMAGVILLRRDTIALAIGGGIALLPCLSLIYRRKQRRARFEALFPDALDLMGYALKAGHSIMASLKMVAEEIKGPVAEEFGRVVEEINFGRSIDDSLRALAGRIDSVELRYFVTSVIIQRETGGNLVAILESISEVIRKKFRFRERVRSLSAEGKLSAVILIILPVAVAGAISVMNPKYVRLLITDPIGHYFIVGAIVLLCLGSFVMYRMIQLDM